ncbi:MAG: carboxypeptidase-like regulatory domain-containing protein [Gemmatimonadota bacterium]|nr:carboxypeptidase-like regulatory domain-containing protein [Gemmatimonadota bacterium]
MWISPRIVAVAISTLVASIPCPVELSAFQDCDAGQLELSGGLSDVDTGVALPGVQITVSWVENGTAGSGRSVTTLDGTFRLCLPEDASEVRAWGTLGTVHGEVVEIDWPGSAPVALTLGLHGGESPVAVTSVREASEAGSEYETGGVRGTVSDATSEEPVVGARIDLDDGASVALSGESGAFLLPALQPGEHVLRVERLGYAPLTHGITARAGQITALTVQLAPEAVAVEPLVVSVFRDARLDRVGFYERKEIGDKIGLGEFMTPEEIRESLSPRVSQLLDRVQLLDMIRVCGATCLLIPRVVGAAPRIVTSGNGTAPCPADVYIDGTRVRMFRWRSNGSLDVLAGIDEFVIPTAIVGIEVYRRASELPAEFGGATDGCGAVVIWTR